MAGGVKRLAARLQPVGRLPEAGGNVHKRTFQPITVYVAEVIGLAVVHTAESPFGYYLTLPL